MKYFPFEAIRRLCKHCGEWKPVKGGKMKARGQKGGPTKFTCAGCSR